MISTEPFTAVTCRQCGAEVPWQTYLTDWHHADCGGQIRPAIVLYEEGFSEENNY